MHRSLLVVIIIAIIIRCYFAYSLGLAEDEAYYWTWAQRLDVGYFDHPPMIAWWIALGTQIDHSEWAVRLLGLCSYPAILWLAWELSNHKPLTLWVLVSFPLLLGSFLATPDMPLLFFWTLTLWAIYKDKLGWIIIGTTGACLSKLTGFLLVPIIIALNAKRWSPKQWSKFASGIILGISPFLWWNTQHDWISFGFQWEHIRSSSKQLSFLLSQWGLIGVLLFPVLLYTCNAHPKNYQLKHWATIPLLGIGLLIGGEANWIAPAYVGISLLLGETNGISRKIVWLGVCLNLFFQALMILHSIHPLRTLPNDPLHRLSGGQTLGDSIAAWNETEIWCSRYQEASLIWFYSDLPTQTIPQHSRPSQYDFWRPALANEGLFIRPLRLSSYREIETLGRDTSDVFVISAFSPHQMYQQPVHQWQVFPFSKK